MAFGGLGRSSSVPAALSSGALQAVTPAQGHRELSGGAAAGGVKARRWPGPPLTSLRPQDTWSSGFPRSAEARDPDGLSPLELFKWLAAAVDLSEEDIDSLQPCRSLSHIEMAKQVYSRLLEFAAIRIHLRTSTEAQVAQRMQMLEKYLAWCMKLQRGSTDSYVSYLDRVARVHQRGRNRVPCTQLLVGLAIAQDVFLRHLCASIRDEDRLQRSACAVSKLMWIQAVFFVRHARRAGRGRQGRLFWSCLLALWAALACSRRLTAWGGRRAPAVLVDLAVATAGSTLALELARRWA